MVKKSVYVLLFLFVTTTMFAQELFRFQYRTGQQFHVEGTVDEEIYKNDVLIDRVRLKNVGDLTVTGITGDRAMHEGTFSYYRSSGDNDFYLEEQYPTRFYRDIYGNYFIDNTYFMPVVRGVPTFPKTPVKIGEQWQSGAYEAHDFRTAFGIQDPVILPAAVSYQYLGNLMIEGEKIAKISINYIINYTLKYAETGFTAPLPFRVVGYFNQLYYWNLDRGLPHSYRENFDYIFIMSNGDIQEYVGKSRAFLTIQDNLNESERVLESIRNTLKKNIPSVEVSMVDQGILINIGEILFRFDSDEFTEGAGTDLDNIVEVLNEFPDRDIRVIGHTDSTGPEDYNRSLSIRRSKRTAQEIKKRLPRRKGGITYIGMGEEKPIASNETEEGRQKNRRVEIIILNK